MNPRRNPTAPAACSDSTNLNRLNTPGASSLVMGILNVTPDSFSDGGSYVQVDLAVTRTIEMIEEGADIIDIGPESTRPGSKPVGAQVQIKRAVPVIEAIRRERTDVPISIDTRLAEVACAALEAGADWVNDVSALRDDPAMADLIAATGAPIVLMHRKGDSFDMQRGGGPYYNDVVAEIVHCLRERMDFAIGCGIDPQQIILDPGIGFGKRAEDNVMILQQIERFLALGKPLMLGASRKSFLAKIVEEKQPNRRDAASIGCCVVALLAAQRAASAVTATTAPLILRVHDVAGTRQVVELCKALTES